MNARRQAGPPLRPVTLRLTDVLRVGVSGLWTRPVRVVLSALGIAIGVAAMVAVVGISSSSRADLDKTLDSLGTNLLTASPGSTIMGKDATMPAEAVPMVRRIGPMQGVTSTASLDARAYRSDLVPENETGSIAVVTSDLDLPETVGAEMWKGQWLTEATSRFPAVVLGRTAAARLGVAEPDPRVVILVGGVPSTVVGILDHAPLAPELDTSVLVGHGFATDRLGWDALPTRLYMRADPTHVEAVRGVVAATAKPSAPNEINVSRPSDALAAQEATDAAFTGLLLGLGAVALLVGGIGVANTMVISVMERRAEIGLRRSLGATRGHVLRQFLIESLALSVLGGIGGVVIGWGITAVYATGQGWATTVPPLVVVAGVALTMVTGMVAGILPAVRAARLSPTAALTG